jgi:hypothetical protein
LSPSYAKSIRPRLNARFSRIKRRVVGQGCLRHQPDALVRIFQPKLASASSPARSCRAGTVPEARRADPSGQRGDALASTRRVPVLIGHESR